MSVPVSPIEPADTKVMAPKVKWSALWSALAAIILAAIPGLLDNRDIIEGVPDWLTALAAGLGTGSAAGFAGYRAPHQPRAGDSASMGGYPAGDYP